jgi:AAA family ATP:ADP antiporter
VAAGEGVTRAWSRATGVLPHERTAVGWSFSLFFCVFASWYLLRPIRDAMGIVGHTRELPRLFLVTLGVTLAVAPALAALVSRFGRRACLAVAYRFLAATLVGFVFVLRGNAPAELAARAFFVWASVFNLLAVTLAWALMADVFSHAQGIRLFGLIGGGGTLGGLAGSLASALLVPHVGIAATLLVSAALLEAGVRCIDRIAADAPADRARAYAEGGVLRWALRALTTPFFLGVCAYLALFTFTSTAIYFEQASIVRATIADTAARTEAFARIDLAVNALTLVLQLLVVGRALRKLGIAAALALLPLVTFGCFAALKLAPMLGVLVACQIARRTLDYAVVKPAREVLFTVVLPEDKYKAKSFIDTFVYRSGDAIAAITFEGVAAPLMLAGMALVCGAWAITGVVLGRSRAPRPRGERATIR